MTAQVFQPGHRSPSMSIEEAGLHEMEMMQKWQERNSKVMEKANSFAAQRGHHHANGEVAEVEKARGWDDWKDDHRRSAGNKKLTPCGTPEVASFPSSSVGNSWPHPMAAFFLVLVVVFSAPIR